MVAFTEKFIHKTGAKRRLHQRPNPKMLRSSVFNFLTIQTGRKLSYEDVLKINYVIKARAKRYIAASDEAWLFPEKELKNTRWDKLADKHLFMPDPRIMQFSACITFGFSSGGGAAFDMYGRRPQQKDYRGTLTEESEFNSFNAFKGEYSRIWGPLMRGQNYEGCGLSRQQDSAAAHKESIASEAYYKTLIKAKKVTQ